MDLIEGIAQFAGQMQESDFVMEIKFLNNKETREKNDNSSPV